MEKRKIVIAQNIDNRYRTIMNGLLPDWEIVVGKNTADWEQHVQDAEIIVNYRKEMNPLISSETTKLKWLQSWSAGLNSLPLNILKEKKVTVTGANGVHAYPISETIFGLMLALTRLIHTYVKQQQSKTWHNAGLKLELHKKTLGLIGVGAIGTETAEIAKAFGMNVLGVRRSKKPAPFVDSMYTIDQLDSVLPMCDYVVITLPLTKETTGLFGAEQFNLMKRSAFFINIGRGQITVENDLIQALKEKRIAGAGLDVFETEPLPKTNPLWEMDNVIITPHTAGATEYYEQRIIDDIFLPNLKMYLKGKQPEINLLDYEKGY